MPQDAATPPTASRLPPGLPGDWHFELDYECLKCRYNLKMLREPRCPECGDEFRWQQILHTRCPRCDQPLDNCDDSQCPRCAIELNWPALIGTFDQRALAHFEYTPRWRRGFRQVARKALRPARFWAELPIEWSPVPARLRVFALLLTTSLMLSFLAFGVACWFVGSLNTVASLIATATVLMTMQICTCLVLPLFAPTLLQFRIRRDQLLRVMVYSLSGWRLLVPLNWFLAAWMMALYLNWWFQLGWLRRTWYYWLPAFFDPLMLLDEFKQLTIGMHRSVRHPLQLGFDAWIFGMVIGTILLWWRSLYLGLNRYLRVDRRNTLALLISTQAIGLLIMVLLLLLTPYGHDRFGRLLLP